MDPDLAPAGRQHRWWFPASQFGCCQGARGHGGGGDHPLWTDLHCRCQSRAAFKFVFVVLFGMLIVLPSFPGLPDWSFVVLFLVLALLRRKFPKGSRAQSETLPGKMGNPRSAEARIRALRNLPIFICQMLLHVPCSGSL